MKLTRKLSVFVICSFLLAACGKVYNESDTDDREEQPDEIIDDSFPVDEYIGDTLSQLEIIGGSYDILKTDYFGENVVYPIVKFAVTDLNHNDRLEVIATSCQGSDAFSHTIIYEMSEDHTALERLQINGEIGFDEYGDFLMHEMDENVAVYNCYKKGDTYFYLLEDYGSSGWSNKYLVYYLYSIDEGVTRDFIGGCTVSPDDEKKEVKKWLYDSAGCCFEDDESFYSYIDEYLSGYEKINSCEVKWMNFSDDNFRESVEESFNSFNSVSQFEDARDFDYITLFDGWYGPDGYEYIIQKNTVQDIYRKFLSGDMSLLDESSSEMWFVPDFINDDSEYEYTMLDLDDDGADELWVQMADSPGGYNALFTCRDGKVVCLGSDSVEMNCYNIPLQNGLIVEEYYYNSSVSYNIFRYQSDGTVEKLAYLYVREEDGIYQIDDVDVTKEEFEKSLKELVTDLYLDRSYWTPLG